MIWLALGVGALDATLIALIALVRRDARRRIDPLPPHWLDKHFTDTHPEDHL